MNAQKHPTPWRIESLYNGIADAKGAKVAANLDGETTQIIVDAVNLHEATRSDRHALQEANEAIALLESEHDELCSAVRKLLPRALFLNGYFLGKHASAEPDDAESAAEDFDKTNALIEKIERLVNHNPERNPKQ